MHEYLRDMDRCAFIINSQSANCSRIIATLKSVFGLEHAYWQTNDAGDALKLAQKAVDQKMNYIIAVGGDGTLNEVVNGLLTSGTYHIQHPILAVFPNGTGNDFARTMHCASSAVELLEKIRRGNITTIDIGEVRFIGSSDNASVRYFINVMDAGLGGYVADRVNQYRRSKWSFFAYQRAILKILPFYRTQLMTIESDNLNYSGRILSVAVANGKWFGSGLCISPDAEPNDGFLNITCIGDVGIWEYIVNLPRLMRGKKIQHCAITYAKTTYVRLTSENLPALELDGEFAGHSAAEIRVIRGAVRWLS